VNDETQIGVGARNGAWRHLTLLRIIRFAVLLGSLAVDQRAVWAAEQPHRVEGSQAVHFAFSESTFHHLNHNDAAAAIRVYAQFIADENGLSVGSGNVVLEGTNALAAALRAGEADLISVTADEFFALENHLVGPLLLTRTRGICTEEMLLLAREGSDLQKVADLRGHSLVCSSDVRAILGPLWLETILQEHGLGSTEQVQIRITTAAKPTQVVLPVFFGKIDACLVTRNNWEVMGELNPQVKQRLRVIAASPPVVPTMSCFRRGFSEQHKQRIVTTAVNCKDKPSFQQLMALFKTDDLAEHPLSILESTRELFAKYRKICAGTNQTRETAPTPDSSR
jgi:ABC-type phosphate/phosphonate transport system substrate-binding protein